MLRQRDSLIILILFLATQIVYWLTLDFSIPPQDSAEFIGVFSSGAVAHPPGYPLLTLLGKIFNVLPLGTYARFNFLSALLGSATVCLVYWSCRTLGISKVASAFASVMLAFGGVFWKYSTIIEVFTLNALLTSIALFLAIKYYQEQNTKWIVGLFFIVGLGAAHLHTLAFFLLPLIVVLLVYARKKIDLKTSLHLVLAFLAGLFPYYTVILSAQLNRPIIMSRPQSFSEFIGFFLRKDFGTLSLSPFAGGDSLKNWASQMANLSGHLVFDFVGFGLILAIIGGIVTWKNKNYKPLLIGLVVFLFAGFPIFLWLANAPNESIFNFVIQKQYSSVYVLVALFLAFGYDFLKSKMPVTKNKFTVILWVLPLILLIKNYSVNNRHPNNYTERYVKLLLDSVEPNSVVISCYDTVSFAIAAVQGKEHYKNDVVSVPIDPTPSKSKQVREQLEIASEATGFDLIKVLLKGYEEGVFNRPIYFSFGGLCQGRDLLGTIRNNLAPQGLVLRYTKKPNGPDWLAGYQTGLKALSTWLEVFNDLPNFVRADVGTQEVIGWVSDAYGNLANSAVALGEEEKAKKLRDLSEVLKESIKK